MVTQVIMPKLAANIEEAMIGQWFKQEGDPVVRDELLFEAITDKAAVEVKAEGDGVLRKIHAPEHSVVPVGQVIALIADPDEALPDLEAAPGPQARPRPRVAVKASFGARRLARQLGVDLAVVTPSRGDGRITEDDVRRAAEPVAAGPGVLQTIPLSPLKRAVADHLSRTVRSVAASCVTLEVDFSAVQAAVGALSATAGVPVQPRDVVVFIAGRLLPQHRLLNACFDETAGIRLYEPIHIGLAFDIERDDAVLVPVVRDADRKSLAAIARETAELVRRLEAHELGPADFADATFTVTDQSALGIDSFVPILHDAQSAILAMSAIRPRPLVRGGKVTVAPAANLAVAFDHRVLNGASAARFLRAVRDALEAFRPAAEPRANAE